MTVISSLLRLLTDKLAGESNCQISDKVIGYVPCIEKKISVIEINTIENQI